MSVNKKEFVACNGREDWKTFYRTSSTGCNQDRWHYLLTLARIVEKFLIYYCPKRLISSIKNFVSPNHLFHRQQFGEAPKNLSHKPSNAGEFLIGHFICSSLNSDVFVSLNPAEKWKKGRGHKVCIFTRAFRGEKKTNRPLPAQWRTRSRLLSFIIGCSTRL